MKEVLITVILVLNFIEISAVAKIPSHYPQNPKFVWDFFYEISKIPRPSEKEEKIRNYLVQVAKKTGHKHVIDRAGNVIIYCPASPGFETHEPIIIQNHMDMVCDADPGVSIDFENDPLQIQVKGDYLTANGTTLGADNGIGMSMGLSLLKDKSIKHPPLELLFTVTEETSLYGALNSEPKKYLKGKKLINIDSDDWKSFFIGSAGGSTINFTKEIALKDINNKQKTYLIELNGLEGGHSGDMIHLQRANAIHLLGDILSRSLALKPSIVSIKGGKAHNIIPNKAEMTINFDESKFEFFKEIINQATSDWRNYLNSEDLSFRINVKKIETSNKSLSFENSKELISLINIFPHGVHKYLRESKDLLPSFSNNFAVLNLINGHLNIVASLRFFKMKEYEVLNRKMHLLAQSFRLNIDVKDPYPSWDPQFENNDLLDIFKKTFKELNGLEAEVKAAHAGLECGVIIGKMDDRKAEAISFGPTIKGAHTTVERVDIKSVYKTYELLAKILERL